MKDKWRPGDGARVWWAEFFDELRRPSIATLPWFLSMLILGAFIGTHCD